MMFDQLRALCSADTNDLAELAQIVAPGDPAFFDGAEFAGADLRGTDLTAFRLQGAIIADAQMDVTTVLPETTSLSDINVVESNTPLAVHVAENISGAIQTKVISSLDALERMAARQQSSSIRAPVSRRSAIIPQKNDVERNFRLSSIRRMRRIAEDIVASPKTDPTIGGVLKNVGRLVGLIEVCDELMRRYEPRTYIHTMRSINLEMKKFGVSVEGQDNLVTITREQWKSILVGLTSRLSTLRQLDHFSLRGPSGEILGDLMLRLFFVLEDVTDLYLTLPADRLKIDPVSFQIRLAPLDREGEMPEFREPYQM